MIITCGQCQARFKVAPEQIKETGSKVRCSNCQYVFTVYRPRREEVPPGPAAAPSRPNAYSGAGENIFDDDDKRPPGETRASRRAGAAADDYGPEEDDDLDFDVFFDDGLKVDKSSRAMKERRLQRRRLYSDLEAAPPGRPAVGDEDLDALLDDDLLDDDFDDEDFDSPAGRPPLRRDSARRAKTRRPSPPPVDGDFNEEDFEDAAEAGYEDASAEADPLSVAVAGPAAAEEPRTVEAVLPGSDYELGLAADPVETGPMVLDMADAETAASQAPVLRAAGGRPSGASRLLLLVMAIAASVLAIGLYLMSGWPEPTALSSGEESAADSAAAAAAAAPPAEVQELDGDREGTRGITFPRNNHNHSVRENNPEGQILIIPGMVSNGYPERRSFIRLRGALLAADGSVLADRYVYAGNLISEAELTELPMNEIIARLTLKGGQNGLNMHIDPGREIPFMVVFGNLPEAMAEYAIDPVGSSSSD
jgi:predicted Zn finger-like uncharacterized protein